MISYDSRQKEIVKQWRAIREDPEYSLNRYGLPDIVSAKKAINDPGNLDPELIAGVLREKGKLLISGPSKAGKSFILTELSICFSEGRKWLGLPVKKCKVLYINLELSEAEFNHRLIELYEAMKIKPNTETDNLKIWNLKGHAKPLDELAIHIIQNAKNDYSVIVIDPIYKVITGDENNAMDMSYFTNQIDLITRMTGASVIYCHHHTKGNQGAKNAMDRASGSGVFARDADAILDIVELEPPGDKQPGLTAWRMDLNTRSFPKPNDINFWFESIPGVPAYHFIDTTGELEQAELKESRQGKSSTAIKKKSSETQKRLEDFMKNHLMNNGEPLTAYEISKKIGGMTLNTVIKYLEKSELLHCEEGKKGPKKWSYKQE